MASNGNSLFLDHKGFGGPRPGAGVAEAPRVCVLHSPGVAAQPPSPVTPAEEAGSLGGSRARPKGSGSHGPAWSSVTPGKSRLCGLGWTREWVGLDHGGRAVTIEIHTDPVFEFCLFYLVCQLLEDTGIRHWN